MRPSRRYTRKAIVLAAANKDGGAHVDRTLTLEYEKLIADGCLGPLVNTLDLSVTPITDAHFAALRQFGFEVLNSPERLNLAV